MGGPVCSWAPSNPALHTNRKLTVRSHCVTCTSGLHMNCDACAREFSTFSATLWGHSRRFRVLVREFFCPTLRSVGDKNSRSKLSEFALKHLLQTGEFVVFCDMGTSWRALTSQNLIGVNAAAVAGVATPNILTNVLFFSLQRNLEWICQSVSFV